MRTLQYCLAAISAGIAIGMLLRGKIAWCYAFGIVSVIISLSILGTDTPP